MSLKNAVSPQDDQAGNPDASLVLVEYGDYQCPHCGHAHPLIKRLLKEKGGELLFVYRNFPLQEMHPAAFPAAVAAEAAGKRGKFWPMHDMIFENQQDLHGNSFVRFAETLGMDMAQFREDMENEAIIAKVEGDFEGGIRSGVNGTPTFFLNGERVTAYDGSYESLVAMLRNA